MISWALSSLTKDLKDNFLTIRDGPFLPLTCTPFTLTRGMDLEQMCGAMSQNIESGGLFSLAHVSKMAHLNSSDLPV